MKLESRRERAERLKKQRRSTLTGMIIAIIVVVALGVVLWRGKAGLEEKNADYQAQITELQSKIDDENKRSDELSEYEKYVKTKKFVEEIAKNKFGLIYPDELVFKHNNKKNSYQILCRSWKIFLNLSCFDILFIISHIYFTLV